MPATITLHNIPQGTEEWHQARAGKYTGSNAWKLLTNIANKKVIDGILSAYSITETSDFTGNFHTKRGHVLEDEAIEVYEVIYNTTVLRPGFITNSDYPCCLYSPDGVDGDWLLEVKCFAQAKHLEIFKGLLTLAIKAQVQFGMMISGKKKARLIIYHPKLDLGNKALETKYAFKVIELKANPLIFRNFKKLLGGNNG